MIVSSRFKGDAAGTRAASEEGHQPIVVIPLVHKAEALLPSVRMLHQSHVDTLCNINRDPRSRCDRISLASHRQSPPEVVEQLQDAVSGDGWLPLRMYYGPEYLSGALQQWAIQKNIRIDYIQPGKPQQNAYVERFNRTVRYDWLAQTLFGSIAEVQDAATRWLWTYNHERPNMGLGGITPMQRLAMVA